jgi:hypothetical protein
MVRLHGRCARGERLVDFAPQGHWKTITFVAALRQNGMTAPCTIDGSTGHVSGGLQSNNKVGSGLTSNPACKNGVISAYSVPSIIST